MYSAADDRVAETLKKHFYKQALLLADVLCFVHGEIQIVHYNHVTITDLKSSIISDFICDFGKLPFPTHLGKYFIKIGKIRAKIHEIGKIKAIFGLGMTPIYGLKND